MDRRMRLALTGGFLVILCMRLTAAQSLADPPGAVEDPDPAVVAALIELKTRLYAGELSLAAATAPLEPEASSRSLDDNLVSWTRLAYESCRDGNWEIYLARGDGSQPTRLTNHPALDMEPRLNIGATRVAFVSDRDGNSEVYTVNVDGSGLARLTFTPAAESHPCWSPDGSHIVFASKRDGDWDIYVMRADGSGQVPLIDWGGDDVEPAWSPDDSLIAWVRRMDEKEAVLWLMRPDGSNAHAITGRLRFLQHPAWSPGGTRICVDADYDNDYWNEAIELDTQGQLLGERADYTPGDSWWLYLMDTWMGAWSPAANQVVVTVLHYAIQDGKIVLSYTSLEVVPGNAVSSSGCDIMPDWQTEDLSPPWAAIEPLPHYVRTPELTMRVAWRGADAGPAGIRNYDVDVHDETTPAWTEWLRAVNDTSALLSTAFGKTYYFRVRALDYAGHYGLWTLGRRDGTIAYAFGAAGEVRDARDRPVPNASVRSDPAPLAGGATDVFGRFRLYSTAVADHQVTAAHVGYSSPMSTTLAASQDAEGLSLWLRPMDDSVVDGAFERGTLDNWQLQGLYPAVLAPVSHSGQAALLLGQPLTMSLHTLLDVEGGLRVRMPFVLDAQGNVHLIVSAMYPESGMISTCFFTRPVGAGWSTCNQLADAGACVATALDADGNLHAVGLALNSDSVPEGLLHKSRRRDGSWSEVVRVPGAQAGRGSVPQAVVDTRGALHVVWPCQTCDGRVLHAVRSSGGVWSMLPDLPAGSTSLDSRPVVLARGSDDTLHAVWYEGVGWDADWDSLKLVYSRRPPDGLWSAPVALAASTPLIWLREWPVLVAAPANRLYLFWMVRGAHPGNPGHQGVYFRRSDDGGLHWSETTHVSTWDPWWEYRSGAAPAVVADARGWLHAVWSNPGGQNPGGTYYSLSRDAGLTWSRPLLVGPELAITDSAADPAHSRLYVGASGIVAEMQQLSDSMGDVSALQRVSIASDAHKPTLSFFYRLDKPESGSADRLQVLLDGREAWSASSPQEQWTHVWVDLEAWRGQTVTLALNLRFEWDGDRTAAYLDDVTVGSWWTPVVHSVSPARVGAGEAITLTVTGENMYPGEVYLGSGRVPEVQSLNEATLVLTLPATWPPGIHDLRVVNPGGQEGVLVQAVGCGLPLYLPAIFK